MTFVASASRTTAPFSAFTASSGGSTDELAWAFLLTIIAGIATFVGGLVVYSKRLISCTKAASLAIALSVSCGAILFSSLVEVFPQSRWVFEQTLRRKHGLAGAGALSESTSFVLHGNAWFLSSICFAAGIFLVYFVDFLVLWLSTTARKPSVFVFASTVILEKKQKTKELSEEQQEKEGEDISCVAIQMATPNTTGLPPHGLLLEYENHFSNISQAFQLDEADADAKPEPEQVLHRTGLLTTVAIALHHFPSEFFLFLSFVSEFFVFVFCLMRCF